MPRPIFHLCAALVFGFIAAIPAYAQTPGCPTVTVSGPAGTTSPGESFQFTATLDKTSPNAIAYRWTVSTGTIVEGQGTDRIKVDVDWEPAGGVSLTATVEIVGLPKECSSTASETAGVACNCQAVLMDMFSISPSRIDKSRLDALIESLTTYPAARLHIIEYFKFRTSETIVQRKLKLIRKHLVDTRGLKPSEFEIATETSPDSREWTKLYVVPPGASDPTP